MSDLIRRALAAVVVLLVVTACRPITSGNGWEALDIHDNKPVVRAACTVRYRINADTLPDRGRKLLGYDLVTVVHEQVAATSAQSGLRWVFDGYTHATYDGTGGTRSAKAWARSNGVLIELRWLDNGWGGWSQPLTSSDRSRYTGGIMWLSTRVFDLRASLERDPRTDAGRHRRPRARAPVGARRPLRLEARLLAGRCRGRQQDGQRPIRMGSGRPCRVRCAATRRVPLKGRRRPPPTTWAWLTA